MLKIWIVRLLSVFGVFMIGVGIWIVIRFKQKNLEDDEPPIGI